MGENQSEALKLDNDTLSLDIAASDLMTLQALNAARLKEAGAVDASFVSRTINDKPLNLGQGIWLNDSAEGNLIDDVVFTKAYQLTYDANGGVKTCAARLRSAVPPAHLPPMSSRSRC